MIKGYDSVGWYYFDVVSRHVILCFCYILLSYVADDGHSPDPCGRSGNGGGSVRCAISGSGSAAPATVVSVVEQRSLAVVRHAGFGSAGSGRRDCHSGSYRVLVR